MRYLGLVPVLALTIGALQPLPAAAQQAGTPMGDLMDLNRFATRGFMNQWAATRPAAMSGLSQPSRRWIKAEVQRQAEAPRQPSQVARAIDEALGRDIHVMAKSERVREKDVAGAILLKVMFDAKAALAREARRVDMVAAPGERPWEERIGQADLNLGEAVSMQSEISLALAKD